MKVYGMSLLLFLLLLLPVGSVGAASGTGLAIVDGERFVYEIILPDGEKVQSECRYWRKESQGRVLFGYTYNDPVGKWDVLTNAQGYPVEVSHEFYGNPIKFTFGKNKVHMSGFWNGENISEEREFKGLITPEIAMILRNLDLGSKDRFVLQVIQKDEYPELVTYTMYFQVKEDTTITVKAGTFNCKRVVFSLTDWRGLFYKSNQYITNDEYRRIIKMENFPRGGETELKDYEVPEHSRQ